VRRVALFWRQLEPALRVHHAIAICLLSTAASTIAQAPQIRTDRGTVSGFLQPAAGSNRKVATFEGIPYAAPPLAALRWRPPQPAPRWKGILYANHFSPSCMQTIRGEHLPWTREFMAQNPTSEDCLYLNVWTPAPIHASAKRPVLVWIHGGGLIEGAAAPPIYGGTSLAARGIVFVSVNYRLGVFGFLAHPALTAESPQNASGDYGLLDLIAALQWVHRNIASFGGDPNRVTIDGQSSGSTAVQLLIASPLAKHLFRAAIAESGADADDPRTDTLATAESTGTRFTALAGATTLAQLRALPADTLLEAQVAAFHQPQPLHFRPVLDGYCLPGTISTVFSAHQQNDVPTIGGFNADEGSASSSYGHITAAQFRANAERNYGPHAEEFLRLYPASTDAEAQASQKASARDEENVSVSLWASHRARTAHTSAYTYFFTHAIPWPAHPEFGAFHSVEIPYALDNLNVLDRPWQPIDRSLAQTISTYWLNFVRTGNPNGAGLPPWPPAAGETVMELGDHTGPRPIASPAVVEFWLSQLTPASPR
jgi:para-nitrobenzyl esterase